MKLYKEEAIEVEGIPVLLQYKDVCNINIKINKQGQVLVALPYFGARDAALDFVKKKLPWLRKHLAERAQQELPVPDNGFDGSNLWLWGKHYTADFQLDTEERVLLKDKVLVFTYRGKLTESKRQRLVEAFYRKCLEEMLTVALDRWQPILKLYVRSWKLQRLKSKWGRCNVLTRELLFNVSLVHRPLACLEYVVVHELAHLYEPSHNERFHSFLDRYMADWKERRALLNKFIFKAE